MAKVTDITMSKDKNNFDMKVLEFDGGQKVWVHSKYKAEIYKEAEVGNEYNLVKDGSFWAIDDGSAGAPVVESKKAKEIHQAQDRKAESIAWFNATNNAIQMVNEEGHKDERDRQDRIRFWRDWFLREWKEQPPF